MSKINYGKIFLDFFELAFIGASVFLLVYFFVAQLLRVNGDSMLPNFKNDEQILTEKLTYKLREPKRGEIIVFRHPQNENRLLIKRVIALPGDTFFFSKGKAYLNGQELEEPYLTKETKTNEGRKLAEEVEYKVDSDTYLVLGDNRQESSDSRDFGLLPKNEIVGKALLVYYPLKDFKFIEDESLD